jgi:hypothetical protein
VRRSRNPFIHGVSSSSKCTAGAGGRKCDECRAAHARWFADAVRRRRALLEADPTLRPHGNATTYNAWGCRCTECRDAATEHRYRYPFKGKSGFPRQMATGQWRKGKAEPFGREWLDEAGTSGT